MTATGVVREQFVCRFPPTDMYSIDHGAAGYDGTRKKSTVCQACSSFVVMFNVLSASLCPVDAILTRMGAYDNMFNNASTFKVELDEW